MTRSRTIALIGMVVVFAVAYGLDRLAHYMREQLGVTAREALYRGLPWVDWALLLVVAALFVALTWYMVFRGRRVMVAPFKSPAHQVAAVIAVNGVASLVVPKKRRAAAWGAAARRRSGAAGETERDWGGRLS